MKNKKIYIAGHKGLVGSAIHRKLQNLGHKNIITATRSELDLTNESKVSSFVGSHKPDIIFICAAKVGGIHANATYPVEFFLENVQIQNNILTSAFRSKVQKCLFLGSSCIYPKFCDQPIKEEYLLTGSLEETNAAYALAKISGLKLCEFYNNQYGTDYLSAMPCNLYGINDNYNYPDCHVIPALIYKFHQAKIKQEKVVDIWGSGNALREFLDADDLAEALIFLAKNSHAKDIGHFINIGSGLEVSIQNLALLVKDIVGVNVDIKMNAAKPDGTPRKIIDSSKINSIGWKANIDLKTGLTKCYEDFQKGFRH
ncbi:GDP-L-fucose synthase [Bacteriovoracaceae bacterium]|nr:GDP-L-fucose synthase [Bacteriovoracaceae bacterium]